MATEQFLSRIFPTSENELPLASSRTEITFANVQEHIKQTLSIHDVKEKQVLEPEQRAIFDGRIGNETVLADLSSQCGNMKIDKEKIEIESQSNFSSIRANICVCKGKWMYEVLLGSKGIMQLGWATLKCRFTNEEGVGDTADSYAYDGHRVRKWNVATGKYGEEWMAGDIIGVLIDMDEGCISYTRNGHELGTAFSDIRRGKGYAYFPAISLSFAEVVQLNFGGTPYRYPVEGYSPLQDPPICEHDKAQELFNSLDRLLPTPNRIPDTSGLSGKVDTVVFLTVAHIFEQLAPMLMDPYIVESHLVPALLSSCNPENPFDTQEGVKQLLEYMWSCLEDFEIQCCFEYLIWSLVKGYWYGPVDSTYKKQRNYLVVVLELLRHQPTCRLWLSSRLCRFHKFPYMLHIRPPDDRGMKEAFEIVWWDGLDQAEISGSGERKLEYERECKEIKEKVTVLENIQVELCKILMQMDDSSSRRDPRALRVILTEKIRKSLQDHHLAAHSLQPVQSCSGPVMTCFVHRLIKAFHYHWDLWAKESGNPLDITGAHVSPNAFYDDSLNYFDLARTGGIISHLKKAHRDELKSSGGASAISRLSSLSSALSSLVGSGTSSHSASNQPRSDPLDKTLVELLDTIILMYHTAVHRQLSKVHGVTETMREHSKALVETQKKVNKCPEDRKDVIVQLERARKVFTSEATEVARHMGWVKSVIFSKEKQEDLHWLIRCVLRTISASENTGKLFAFLPEFYIETAIFLFQALWNYFMPLTTPNSIEGYEETLQQMANFLSESLCNDKIVNPDVVDTIIQGVATFVCYPETLHAIENTSLEMKKKVMRYLMSAYDKRTWVHTTWILVRFWRGDGFGFRHATSPDLIPFGISDQGGTIRAFTQKPCPSKAFQKMMRTLCLGDQQLSNDFLNGVLNQLNWAFSEFVGILQEIQQATARLDAVLPDTRQLRTCGICFDLTVGLLRVLEMVCSVVPEVFTDYSRPSAELTLVRLFQAVVQILNRVTASYRLFETLSRLHATDIERQDRYAVLAAIAGILLTMLSRINSTSRKPSTLVLLGEPGFQLEPIAFLAGNPNALASASASASKQLPAVFSFRKFKEVSDPEADEIETLFNYLQEQHAEFKFNKQESLDADTVCPICYAMPVTVKFVPCGHTSCRPCITRHMMNIKQCFFCKESVKSLKDLETDVSMESK
eukprot:gene5877-6566_t